MGPEQPVPSLFRTMTDLDATGVMLDRRIPDARVLAIRR